MRTEEKDRDNLKYTGIALMVISVWCAVQAVQALLNPASITIEGGALPHDTVVYVGVVVGLVLNAIEFYFGYVAFRLHPSQAVILVSLVVGILLLAGSGLLLAMGDGMNFGAPLCSGIVAIAYYVYAKRVVGNGGSTE